MLNKQKNLTKLVLAYFNLDATENTVNETSEMNRRLKACLFHFFNNFVADKSNGLANIYMLAKVCAPVIKFSLNKKKKLESIKKMAAWFYELTSGFIHADTNLTDSDSECLAREHSAEQTNNSRLFLISSLVDEIFKTKFEDYYLAQQWIEVLVEFNVHAWDVCEGENEHDSLFKESIDYLNKILNQLLSLMVRKASLL
jgi:hypothetical protein